MNELKDKLTRIVHENTLFIFRLGMLTIMIGGSIIAWLISHDMWLTTTYAVGLGIGLFASSIEIFIKRQLGEWYD